MRIAVLGTGKVGSALGRRLSLADHTVTYGSRTPTGGDTVSQADAVQDADVVVIALPGTAVLPTLESIGADVLSDRVLLDVSAAFTPEGNIVHPHDSIAEQLQERFPRARVVKTLNTMNYAVMVNPFAGLDRATVFVSGDDATAKNTVSSLLTDLGWTDKSILDLGGVATARATEHAAPLFFATFRALQTMHFNISISR